MRRIGASFSRSSTASAASDCIATTELKPQANGWLLDCECRQLSPQTIALRWIAVDNLLWFLRQQQDSECGTPELRAFLAYLGGAHEQDGGWRGNGHLRRRVRPSTVATYHRHLRTLFRFLVDQRVIDECWLVYLTDTETNVPGMMQMDADASA